MNECVAQELEKALGYLVALLIASYDATLRCGAPLGSWFLLIGWLLLAGWLALGSGLVLGCGLAFRRRLLL